jgi:hypothetical protein
MAGLPLIIAMFKYEAKPKPEIPLRERIDNFGARITVTGEDGYEYETSEGWQLLLGATLAIIIVLGLLGIAFIK